MPAAERIEQNELKRLSTKTADDMLDLVSGNFQYTPEIKNKVKGIMGKIMEMEKKLDVKEITRRFKIKADKQKEFANLNDNYKINILSRYYVYENLDENECNFVEENRGHIQALNNLVMMHNEAEHYVLREGGQAIAA